MYTNTSTNNKVVDSHARTNDIIQWQDFGNDNQRWNLIPQAIAADTEAPEASLNLLSEAATLPSSPVISGTATDTGGSGFGTVRVAIRDRNSGLWYNFSDNTFGSFDSVNASLSSTTTSQTDWAVNTSLPNGEYAVIVRAIDAAGNFQTKADGTVLWTWNRFLVSSLTDVNTDPQP